MSARSDSNEIRFTRVYDAPAKAVWDAWTVPEQVAQWWGPRGFSITTHSKDLRVGGAWRYTMHGPDGVDYPNVTRYFEVVPHEKLVYDHGGTDDTPPLFRVHVTFSESRGRTTMKMVFTLASPEAAAETAKFIKRAGGMGTWDRLAEHLAERETGQQRFVIHRDFEAPRARVFEAWVNPEQLVKWLPPAGTRMRFLRSEIAPGKSTLFVIEGDAGAMHVRADYLEIESPRRIVYSQQFVDERGNVVLPPGAVHWPATLRTTVLLEEDGPERTRVTLTTEVQGDVRAPELEAFVRERSGMTLGWTGSFDVLDTVAGTGV